MGWGADNPPGGPLVAPAARRVDMLSGDVAPTKYFQALSEADQFVREVDTLRESQTRNQELEAENADLRRQLGQRNETIEALRRSRSQAMVDADVQARKVERLTAENNDLAEQLHRGSEAHKITLGFLADAKREKRAAIAERDKARAERDTANLRAGAKP